MFEETIYLGAEPPVDHSDSDLVKVKADIATHCQEYNRLLALAAAELKEIRALSLSVAEKAWTWTFTPLERIPAIPMLPNEIDGDERRFHVPARCEW